MNRNELVVKHMGVVKSVMRSLNINMKHREYEDIEQMGYESLIKASKSFDETKGSFGKFAKTVVRNDLLVYLQRQSKVNKAIIGVSEYEMDGEIVDIFEVVPSYVDYDIELAFKQIMTEVDMITETKLIENHKYIYNCLRDEMKPVEIHKTLPDINTRSIVSRRIKKCRENIRKHLSQESLDLLDEIIR